MIKRKICILQVLTYIKIEFCSIIFFQMSRLNLSNQNLTELPSDLPQDLVYLDCSDNNIKELPTLPSSLQELDCSGNLIKKIDNLPKNLKKLVCVGNIKYTYDFYDQLPEDSYHYSYGKFAGDFEDYDSIEDEFYKIKEADPRYFRNENFLTELTNLPDSLEYLDISDNDITDMPELPKNLKTFIADGTLITDLGYLPESLEYFSCVWSTKITYRSSYFYSDEDFDDHFYDNDLRPVITKIKNLPQNIKEFYIDNQYLEYIDDIKVEYLVKKYDLSYYGYDENNGYIVFDLKWYNQFKKFQRKVEKRFDQKNNINIINEYLHDWIWKPTCNDNTHGINMKMSLKELSDLKIIQ